MKKALEMAAVFLFMVSQDGTLVQCTKIIPHWKLKFSQTCKRLQAYLGKYAANFLEIGSIYVD